MINDISNENDLIDDILESEIIFGCESNAMIIGLLAGKKVISCILMRKINVVCLILKLSI